MCAAAQRGWGGGGAAGGRGRGAGGRSAGGAVRGAAARRAGADGRGRARVGRRRGTTIALYHNGLINYTRRKAARVERAQRRLVVNGGVLVYVLILSRMLCGVA